MGESDLVKFFREILTDELLAEMMPLLKSHYEEMKDERFGDFEFEPNGAFFIAAERNNALRVYTIRNEYGILLGYWVILVGQSVHSMKVKTAWSDALYVKPDERGIGFTFMKWVRAQLALDGIQMFDVKIQAQHDFGVMLERMGFEQKELCFTARLN